MKNRFKIMMIKKRIMIIKLKIIKQKMMVL